MHLKRMASMILGLLVLATRLAEAQAPGPAAAPSAAADASKTQAPPSPDFKVVFWYHRRSPLETFRHQVYDVRKGEYTPHVDDWLEKLRKEYPHYLAYVKEVTLKEERERARPQEAVANAVRAELVAAVAPTVRKRIRQPEPFIFGGSSTFQSAPARSARSTQLMPRSSGAPGSYGPPAYTFPNPFPYPRPHP